MQSSQYHSPLMCPQFHHKCVLDFGALDKFHVGCAIAACKHRLQTKIKLSMEMLGSLHYSWRLLVVLLAIIPHLHCAKIVLFTPPVNGGSKSHRHIATKLGETLASRGHDVTMVLQGVERTQSKLLKSVIAKSPYDQAFFNELDEDIKQFSASIETGEQPEAFMKKFQEVIETECRALLSDEDLFSVLEKEKFDLAIVDHYYNCGFVAASKLRLKYMIMECSSSISLLLDIPGAPSPLSYVPAFSSGLTDEMDFLGRLKNLLMVGAIKYFFKGWMQPWEAIAVDFLPEGKSLQELKSTGEMWLVNNDFSLEYPRPLLPNTVFIGGLLTSPAKPLPKDFEEFIQGGGGNGIILVSFGSVVDLTLAPKLASVLLQSLGSLKQRVIWAAKSRPLNQEIPANIKFWDWIPQNDLLGHPEVKAFVTHGGINGVYEAIYHAVPTLVIPGTMDSTDNALRLEKKGMGLLEQPIGITVEKLTTKLNKLVNEDSFKANARLLSNIMQNQPQTPAERIVFWTEHVLKFNGAEHFKSPVAKLSFFQYHMLDVFGLLALISLAFIFVIKKLCGLCYRRCCKSKEKQQ